MKKEQIIKTAIKLFVEQGFENTPTSQISNESGVATGTLFHHFKTKEELINGAYVYVKKSMASEVFRNAKGSNKQKIKAIWTAMIKWAFENKDKVRFLEKFYGSSYISNITVEQMQADFEFGAKVFEEAKKEKLIKNISVELFNNVTLGLLYAFSKENKLDSKILEKSWSMYWGMLKK